MYVARPKHLLIIGLLMILAITLPSKQAFWVPTAAAQTSTAITYSLAAAGRVSLAVYNPEGKLVRTLLNAAQRTAGTHTEQWDGKDDAGNVLPTTATYTWKLLQTQGLRAQYQTSLGSTFPTGTGDVWWEQTLGNHDGVRAVTADSTGIYFAVGISEIAPNGLKLSLDGTRRLWSSYQPNVFRGRFALASMDGQLYGLQQDSYVSVHGVDRPNVQDQSVGDTSKSWYTGFRWDALWPGETRGGAEGWCCSEQPMDMAAYNSGTNPQVVLSYLKHNTVQWRDPRAGTVLDSATITAPKGIALDNAGNMLVISESRVLKLSRTNKTPQVVISGLTAPYRLDVDRTTGNILVAERGTSQQVKRFSATGTLLGTYGKPGGRAKLGTYTTEAGFIDAVDIATLPDGGFIVADDPKVAPRRTSRYDKNGLLVKEWFASSPWTSYISPDPGDPSVVWYVAADRRVVRAKVDYATRAWKVEATYSWAGHDALLNGDSFYNGFRVRTRNGVTYLTGEDNVSVMRVDSASNTLRPCASADWSKTDANGVQSSYTWADADGDGVADASEYRWFTGFNRPGWVRGYFRSDTNMNFVGYSETDKNIWRVDVTGWTAAGCPIFRDLPQVDAAPYGESVAGVNALAKAFISPQTDGSVYGMLNVDLQDWGKPTGTRAVKWGSDGKVRWAHDNMVPSPNFPCCNHTDDVPPPPGKVYAFRQIVGVTNGSVIANDYDGGWEGHPNAITYAWDRDGLWIGGLFENVDTTVAPRELYTLSSDNRGGDLWTDPTTGDVYLFGSWDADYRIYKITGWNNWVRKSGVVGGAALPVEPGTYAIISRASNKGLDVAGQSLTDGGEVQQWSYLGTSNQEWQLTSLGGDEYKITAKHSGKALDVAQISTLDGAQIQQWAYAGNTNQRWRIVSTGDGWFTLRAVHSGKCVDLPDSQITNGVRIKQWQCNGGTNQHWKFQAVTP